MLKKNDKVAIVVCSNGKNLEDKSRLEKLNKVLKGMDLVPIFGTRIYKDKFGRSVSAKTRATEVMRFYEDDSIKAIFDISGGDIANEMLDYLDYDVIKEKNKPFFGYSDVTVVLNAITSKTNQKSYLYQVLNIIDDVIRREDFKMTMFENKQALIDVSWNFLRGKSIEGEIVGGNIRCFLKLAGTCYYPNLDDKILFLEGMSTTLQGLITNFAHLKQIGTLDKISGLLLGTFTKIEEDYSEKDIYEIVREFVPKNISIAKTQQIGHAKDSKMLIIGEKIKIKKAK